MSRTPRLNFEGGIYHVFARGNGKQTIFFDSADKMDFLRLLEKTNDRYEWLCHTYCLMPNHFHLLLELLKGSLSRGMQFLSSIYAQNLNKRKNWVGHVFQGRFKSILIQRDAYLLELSRYIVLNPVRAGFVSDPKDWPWSSYRAIAGLEPKHGCLHDDWILQQFHENKTLAIEKYSHFVLDGIRVKNPMSEVIGQNILGNEHFVRRASKMTSKPKDIEHLQNIQRLLERPALNDIISVSAPLKTRNMQIAEAHVKHGYSMAAIAKLLGADRSTICRVVKTASISGT